jgi:flagellar basal-body rod modification protein FlgD
MYKEGKIMSTTAITSATTATSTTSSTSALTSLTSDDFLKLLLTELENQNPLDPASTKDMASMFGTLTQVSQAAESNTYLSQVADYMSSLSNNQAVSYLDKTITYLDSSSSSVSDTVSGVTYKSGVACLTTKGGDSVALSSVTSVSS